MINYKIRLSQIDRDIIAKKIESLPKRNSKYAVAELVDIYVSLYEDYLVAIEYFIYYAILFSPSVVATYDDRGQYKELRFVADAIYDEGVNSLWQFFDKRAKNTLSKFDNAFGTAIYDDLIHNDRIKELKKHRHNHTAHHGKLFGTKEAKIRYETPVIVLNMIKEKISSVEKKINLPDTAMINFYDLCMSNIDRVLRFLNCETLKAKVKEEIKATFC